MIDFQIVKECIKFLLNIHKFSKSDKHKDNRSVAQMELEPNVSFFLKIHPTNRSGLSEAHTESISPTSRVP